MPKNTTRGRFKADPAKSKRGIGATSKHRLRRIKTQRNARFELAKRNGVDEETAMREAFEQVELEAKRGVVTRERRLRLRRCVDPANRKRPNPTIAEKDIKRGGNRLHEAATWRSPQARWLREKLGVRTRGRIGSGRALVIAAMFRVLLMKEVPRLEEVWRELTNEDNWSLEHAYGQPYARADEKGLEWSSVKDGLIGRPIHTFEEDPRVPKERRKEKDNLIRVFSHWKTRGLWGRLDLDPVELLDYVNVWAWVEIRLSLGLPMTGIALTFDGTFTPVAKEQRQSFNELDEELLNGLLETSYKSHGKDKTCRGINLMLGTDVQTGVAPIVDCGTTNSGEHRMPGPLTARLYKTFERLKQDGRIDADLELEIAYWIGDRAYAWRSVAYDAVFRYGVIPVFPTTDKTRRSQHLHARNMGIPQCRCNGELKDMRQLAAENFYGPAKRRELGLPFGVDLSAWRTLRDFGIEEPLALPQITFGCRECPNQTTVQVKTAPHLYTLLPHKAAHKLAGQDQDRDRYLLRKDLYAARNCSEGVNADIKRAGFGGTGALKAGWLKTYRHVQWLAHGRVWAHTMRLHNIRSGALDAAYHDAVAYKAMSPSKKLIVAESSAA